jgi:hypothetical protein
MRNIFKTSLTLVIAMILVLSMTTVAFAAQVNTNLTQEQQVWLKSNVTVDGNNIKSSDMNIKGKLSTTAPSGDYCMLVLDGGAIIYWSSANDSSLGASINRVSNNSQVSQKMEGLVNNLEVTADTASAGVMLSGVAPLINILLGIVATFIMFGMAISSSLDICYIAFPVVRNKAEDMKMEGNKYGTKKGANGETKLLWFTDDAQYAVNSTITEGNGKSPWAVYFKKRVAAYIFLTIIMFILLTGNITLITDIALKIVSGILNVLQSLA